MAKKKKKSTTNEDRGLGKLLAGTVVLSIVFSAGLITGQRLLRAEARAPMIALTVTEQADESTEQQVPEEVGASLRTKFSFYDHLAGSAQAAPAPAQEANDAPAPVAEAPTVEPQPPAEPQAPEKPAPAASAPAPEPVAANPALAPPAPKPAAAPQQASGDDKAAIADIVASLAGDAPKPEQVKPSEPALPARYTLQVSSHPDRGSAERELERLSEMGVEPHIVAVEVPGRGKLFRVRVGKFHSMDEARDFQSAVKTKRNVAGFVTPL